MNSRRNLVLAALTLFALAWWVVPASRQIPLPGAEAASLLGPLRPAIAAVVRLRFEARRREAELRSPLDDAWRVLALQPESVTDFAAFAAWSLLDAPAIARSSAERDACIAAGFAMVAAGRVLHPNAFELDWVEARALRSIALWAPARLRHAALPEGVSALGLALQRFERARFLAIKLPVRELLDAELGGCAAELLVAPIASTDERAQARRVAVALIADPTTTVTLRDALQSALDAAGK